MARLIVLAGLPGCGKSTLARELARRTGATWLRIDSIEVAIKASGVVPGDLKDAGYRAAHAVAEDNLLLGRDIVADCVNDWQVARDGWQETGGRAGTEVIWIEIVCSDPAEHRHRLETRVVNLPDLDLPDWTAVTGREYHAWDRDHLTIDTSGRTPEACVDEMIAAMRTPSNFQNG
ncbi:MAG TPA: AAA family ATPase [Caulobacteraceae bacterium]|jgi:predicted kinase